MTYNGEFWANVNTELTARNQGLTTQDAVFELIDNSIDAGATVIHITPFVNSEDKLALVVEDDATGFPIDAKNKDTGEIYKGQGLQYCLAYGGSADVSAGTKSIGKFGAGLTLALSCQSPKSEIYTKSSEDNGKYRYNTIDFEQLRQNESRLPNDIQRDPHKDKALADLLKLETKEHGSIIYLTHLDRPDRTTDWGMAQYLARAIGQSYRYFIGSGLKIHVHNRQDVPNSDVKLYDPLMVMPQSRWYKELGPGQEKGTFSIMEKSPDDGKEYPIVVKIYSMPVDQISKNPEFSTTWMGRHRLNMANQGFSLVRKNREIASGVALGIFEKHNIYNYFKGEMSFPPELDSLFNVQVNKSRFGISDPLRNKIKDRIKGAMASLAKEIVQARDAIRAETNESKILDGKRPSETVAKLVLEDGLIRRKKLDAKDEEEFIRKVSEFVETKKEEISLDARLSESQKQSKIQRIDRIYTNFEKPFRLSIEQMGTGEFIAVRDFGRTIEVAIDLVHPFYKKIYEPATQKPDQLTALDLLLFSFAQANIVLQEQNREMTPDEWLTQLNREWSAILRVFIEKAESVQTIDERAEYDGDMTPDWESESEESQVEKIVTVLKNNLGKPMTLGEIYRDIEHVSKIKLDPSTVKKNIRNRLYEYSSDTKMFIEGHEDYFYREGPKKKARWGLRTAHLDDEGGLHPDDFESPARQDETPFEEEVRKLAERCIEESKENKATLDKIYSYVKKHCITKPPPNADRHIRAIVFRNSSDHPGFNGDDKSDIFRHVKDSGSWLKGLWELRAN